MKFVSLMTHSPSMRTSTLRLFTWLSLLCLFCSFSIEEKTVFGYILYFGS